MNFQCVAHRRRPARRKPDFRVPRPNITIYTHILKFPLLPYPALSILGAWRGEKLSDIVPISNQSTDSNWT